MNPEQQAVSTGPRKPWTQPLPAAQRTGPLDLFKLQSPVPMAALPAPRAPGADAAQRLCDQLGQACGSTPWVLLSAGGSQASFEHALTYACRAGASGFLTGRAVWWDALAAYPDKAAVAQALQRDAVPYLRRLQDIAAQQARPWQPVLSFAGVNSEGQVCQLRSASPN